MAKYEFKVGDRVQFKEWDEMEKEFGLDSWGDIKCGFVADMRHLCGTYATIKEICRNGTVNLSEFSTKGDRYWLYHVDMLKPASTKKQKADNENSKPNGEDKPTTYPTITAHLIEGNKTTVMLSDILPDVRRTFNLFDDGLVLCFGYTKCLFVSLCNSNGGGKSVLVIASYLAYPYVKVVDADLNFDYQNGDILKVILKYFNRIMADNKGKGVTVWHKEYVVLEGYDPDIHGKI